MFKKYKSNFLRASILPLVLISLVSALNNKLMANSSESYTRSTQTQSGPGMAVGRLAKHKSLDSLGDSVWPICNCDITWDRGDGETGQESSMQCSMDQPTWNTDTGTQNNMCWTSCHGMADAHRPLPTDEYSTSIEVVYPSQSAAGLQSCLPCLTGNCQFNN
jgi:hypothetical protein